MRKAHKLHVYGRNGVREYLIWCTHEHRIDCYRLVDGADRPLPLEDGIIRSGEFPGLHLDVHALLLGDAAAALAAVQMGVDRAEHRRSQLRAV